MNKRLRFAYTVFVLGVLAPLTGATAQSRQRIVVATFAELQAALSSVNAGRRIQVLAGEYVVDAALMVPDGATLEGQGVMLFDTDGHPSGFEPGTETIIKAAPSLVGDVLTIGDGAAVRGLTVEDFLGRSGGVVVVASREPGDSVSASIRDCEIIAPNFSGAAAKGPINRGLLVFTQNPALIPAPAPHLPPHENAVVTVRMEHCIVRCPRGATAVFATNFAARGHVTVSLIGNVFEGGLDATGGVSRPDKVEDALTTIRSRENLYVRPNHPSATLGWVINGGSSAPFALVAPGTSFNVIRVESDGDRIEGFPVGIFAIGGKRQTASSGPCSNNRTEVRLRDTRIQTEGLGARDFRLNAATTGLSGLPAGDGNMLTLRASGVTGSGPRANVYADTSGPVLPEAFGFGNRLEIIGTPWAFERLNHDIVPTPPADFFVSSRHDDN